MPPLKGWLSCIKRTSCVVYRGICRFYDLKKDSDALAFSDNSTERAQHVMVWSDRFLSSPVDSEGSWSGQTVASFLPVHLIPPIRWFQCLRWHQAGLLKFSPCVLLRYGGASRRIGKSSQPEGIGHEGFLASVIRSPGSRSSSSVGSMVKPTVASKRWLFDGPQGGDVDGCNAGRNVVVGTDIQACPSGTAVPQHMLGKSHFSCEL